MVEGEQNAERLSKATDLYSDLRKRHPGVAMTPPPEIGSEIRRRQAAKDTDQFRQLIAEAEQLVKNRQYQDARTKLDEARTLSSDLWSSDAKAKELNDDVDFHLHFEKARQFYGSGDFAAALTEMNDALQVRPEDKQALDLRNKVQIAADKAEVEQHRQKAASAVAEGILAARLTRYSRPVRFWKSHPMPNGARPAEVPWTNWPRPWSASCMSKRQNLRIRGSIDRPRW